MKQFYQDIITEKSWELLQQIKREFDFILIGGWAVFLYTHSLKSKDIDIIVDYSSLDKLKSLGDFSKNSRLSKYELKKDTIDIDIYLPYYSNIGVPVEEIQINIQKVKTFKVPVIELLLLTKLFAYNQRKGSIKGIKDKIDCLALVILSEFNFIKFNELVKKFQLQILRQELYQILNNTVEVPELKLNRHQFSRIKKQLFNILFIRYI